MWIATTTGFLSAVQAKDDTGDLFVRARVRADLEPLIECARQMTGVTPEVIVYEASDYPWRIRTTKDVLAGFVSRQVLEIDYGNFKDAVAARQGKPRATVYGGVWTALLGLERLDPEARPKAPWWLQYGEDMPDTEDEAGLYDSDDDDDWYDVDAWLGRTTRSIHDLSDEEWRAAFAEEPKDGPRG